LISEAKVFFKAKDLMTVGNIALGFIASIIAMHGMECADASSAGDYVFWAGVALFAAFVFDSFDGRVARMLGQETRFGAEFDNIADLTSYSCAPAFIVYLAYQKVAKLPFAPPGSLERALLAGVVAFLPFVAGCIRFARFNVRKIEVPGFWLGFPRPAGALTIVSFLNSHLFAESSVMGVLGIFVVAFVAFMNLSLFPFISHHERCWSWHLKIILNMVWITVLLSFIGGVLLPVFPRRAVFDMAFMWLFFYIVTQWADIPEKTRQDIKELTREWNQ
jgi:CDP-diacylglycerol--serine O-phosphatidyltransferase